MLTYCLKCITESVNPKVSKTKIGRTTVSSKCDVCGIKKSTFVKNKKQKDY